MLSNTCYCLFYYSHSSGCELVSHFGFGLPCPSDKWCEVPFQILLGPIWRKIYLNPFFFLLLLFYWVECVYWGACVCNCYVFLRHWPFYYYKMFLSLVAISILKFILSDINIASPALLGTVCMVYLFQPFHFQPICDFELDSTGISCLFILSAFCLCLMWVSIRQDLCMTFRYLFSLSYMVFVVAVLLFFRYCLLFVKKIFLVSILIPLLFLSLCFWILLSIFNSLFFSDCPRKYNNI